MVADDQTHTLPADREALERFARFAGYKDRDAFAEALLGHLRKVQRAYARAVRGRDRPAGASGAVVPREGRRPRNARPARRDGFPEAARSLGDGAPLAVRLLSVAAGEFARRQFAELVPLLIERLARSESPDAAMASFDRFLAGLHAGARLFALLNQQPRPGFAGGADRSAPRRGSPTSWRAIRRRSTRCWSRASSARCPTRPSFRPSSSARSTKPRPTRISSTGCACSRRSTCSWSARASCPARCRRSRPATPSRGSPTW